MLWLQRLLPKDKPSDRLLKVGEHPDAGAAVLGYGFEKVRLIQAPHWPEKADLAADERSLAC